MSSRRFGRLSYDGEGQEAMRDLGGTPTRVVVIDDGSEVVTGRVDVLALEARREAELGEQVGEEKVVESGDPPV